MRRVVTLLLFAGCLAAQPKPDKKDVPFLLHASTLIQTEIARPTPKKDGANTTWSIPGESSLAKTPLALPVFLIDVASMAPEKLQLYAFEQKGAHRELTLPTDPILITFRPLGGTLYRIEVVNEVPNGEYAFTVPGSNQFFCFTVF